MKVWLKQPGARPRIPRTKPGVDWTKNPPPKSKIGPRSIEKPSQTHFTWFCMGAKKILVLYGFPPSTPKKFEGGGVFFPPLKMPACIVNGPPLDLRPSLGPKSTPQTPKPVQEYTINCQEIPTVRFFWAPKGARSQSKAAHPSINIIQLVF